MKLITKIAIFSVLLNSSSWAASSAERFRTEKSAEIKKDECFKALTKVVMANKTQWRTLVDVLLKARIIHNHDQTLAQSLDNLNKNWVWTAVAIAALLADGDYKNDPSTQELAQALYTLAENNILKKNALIGFLKSGLGYFLTDDKSK